MDYFTVRRNGDTAEIINPNGQVFCTVSMGNGVYETLTKERAEIIASVLNKEIKEMRKTVAR